MKEFEYLIRDVDDFPKPGIKFKDITPLLSNHEAVNAILNAFILRLKGVRVDKVVGVESRGFLFGMLLAQKLNAGFVPVRKPGKLPSNTISETYSLEYGTDVLEIHQDAIIKNENILVHDDVLATGGTAKAACQLVNRLGGNIIGVNFLIELQFLNGCSQLSEIDVFSVYKY